MGKAKAKQGKQDKGAIRGIYRYSEGFGRMGDLDGVFVATREDIASAMGKDVHLGEVLGKHSDITATISEETVKLLTEDKTAVDLVAKYELSSGIDVLSQLVDQESDAADEEDNEPEEDEDA